MPLTRRSLLATPLALLAQAPASGVVVTTCKDDNTVAFINAATLEILAQVPTGEGPHEVCASADGKLAYASIYGAAGRPGNQIAIFDIASRKELKRVNVAPMRSPHGIVECQGKIWFTAEQSRCVGRYDPATDKVDWVMGTGAGISHMVVLTPDASKLYTANIVDGTVTSIELKPTPGRPPLLKHIPTGERTEGIAISPDGREVWAGNNLGGDIAVIDTTKDEVVKKLPSSKMSFRLAFTPDGKTVAVAGATGNEVVLFDAASRAITARIPTPGSVPQGLLVSPDGKWLFTATGQKVLKIDLTTKKLVGECAAGPGCDGLAWGRV